MKIGFIGAGRVGTNLIRYLLSLQAPVVSVYQRTDTSATDALPRGVKKYTAMEALLQEHDVIFMTVSDGAIAMVCEEIVATRVPLRHKLFVQTSGAISIESMSSLRSLGASCMSLHPLQTFADKHVAMKALQEMHFFVEQEASDLGDELLALLPNKKHFISADQKSRYHAAAVTFSNYAVALAKAAVDMVLPLGIKESEALAAFRPLMKATYDNILQLPLDQALTGPIKRGDVTTIRLHLSSLDQEEQILYKALGRKALSLVRDDLAEEVRAELDEMLEVKK